MNLVVRVKDLVRRSRTDTLVRNSLFLMTTTVVNSVLGYAFWLVIARFFPASEVGLATALISAMTIASLLSTLGLDSALVHSLPKAKSDVEWSRTLNTALLSGALTSVVAAAVVILVLPLVSDDFDVLNKQTIFVPAMIFAIATSNVAVIIDALFIAERKGHLFLARNAAFGLIKLCLAGAVAFISTREALEIFSAWTVASMVAIALSSVFLMSRLTHRFQLSTAGAAAEFKRLAPSLLGHHFASMGAIAPMYVLPVIIVARSSAEESAYFYITWMLGSIFFMISPSVSVSLFAEGSHASEDLSSKARSSAKVIGGLLVPTIAFFALAGPLVLGLFGSDYADHGTTLLFILAASSVPDAVTNIYVAICRVQHRLTEAASLNVGMALATVALAWLLLPAHGIAGVGLAWLLAQSAGAIWALLRLAGRSRATVEAVA